MMKTLELSAEEAETALVELARHVGPGVEIGRPLIANRDRDGQVSVLVDLGPDLTAVWWVNAEETCRLLPLSGGRVELARWRNGQETSRSIGHEPRP